MLIAEKLVGTVIGVQTVKAAVLIAKLLVGTTILVVIIVRAALNEDVKDELWH